jgi:ribosome-interacting GTPase 1
MFRRREKGPINYQAMVPQSVLTPELVHRICREYRIMSCDLIVREDATVDQLLDVIEV